MRYLGQRAHAVSHRPNQRHKAADVFILCLGYVMVVTEVMVVCCCDGVRAAVMVVVVMVTVVIVVR